MTQINPFTGAIIQAGQLQPPQQSAAKDRQIRRAQNLARNSALQGDQLEHQVESTQAVEPASDGRGSNQPRTPAKHAMPGKPDDGEDEHVDLRA